MNSFRRQAAEDIARRINDGEKYDLDNMENADFAESETAKPIPQGIRTEIRHIMQKSYFVIPNMQEALAGFERISEIKRMLEDGDFVADHNYVEAKSLATVAYLILKEVI